MIKLYGIPLSHNVNKVRYCLDFFKLPYEINPVNPLNGGNQTPEYKAVSPTGKIPAITIDGINIFESNAILRYLARREKSPIYPQEAKKAAAVDAWGDYISIHLDNDMGRVIFNRVLAPMLGRPVDENSLKVGLDKLAIYLPIVEKQLEANRFIAGAEFSIADFDLLAVLDPSEAAGVELSSFKKITAWRNDLKSKDFYQKAAKERAEFMQALMAAKK